MVDSDGSSLKIRTDNHDGSNIRTRLSISQTEKNIRIQK